jgi:integrase
MKPGKSGFLFRNVCGIVVWFLRSKPYHPMKLPTYLHQRHLGFYAIVEIPAVVRPAFKNKVRFIQSLETRDLKIATKRLPIVVNQWKAEIEKARGENGPATSFLWEVLQWRKAIEESTASDTREVMEMLSTDWLEHLETQKGAEVAQQAAAVLAYKSDPLDQFYAEWAKSITHLGEKSQSLYHNSVLQMITHFETTNKIDKTSARDYLLSLRDQQELSEKTISVRLTFIRSFITFLDEKLNTTMLPFFSMKALPKAKGGTAKTTKQRAYIPFSAQEVSSLYQAALDRDDRVLADYIAFGAYTGCRIEELGQLTFDKLFDASFKVEDSKTAAGIREVPMHPALLPLLNRWKRERKDYVLWGSNEATFGLRSSPVGQRFGRLKTAKGFGDQHVFHSIRKTVVSQLEQAGISENTTADIVGHDKPRITYGLYSSGASLKQKAEALALVQYDGALGNPV